MHRVNCALAIVRGDGSKRDRPPARPAVRWFRHPPVAAVARGVPQAVPGTGRRRHDGAGDLAARRAAGGRRADRRRQRGPPVPGRRAAAPGRCAARRDPARAGRPQHGARDRRGGAAGNRRRGRPVAAGAAVRPRGHGRGRVPRGRARSDSRSSRRCTGHLRDRARRARDGFRIHPGRSRRRRARGAPLRGEARCRDGGPVPVRRRLLLEQRHVPVPRFAVPGGTTSARGRRCGKSAHRTATAMRTTAT